jgi:predicted permease
MMSNLWFDIRYASRLLRKSPGHSLLCALVVALSVGLALFVFVMDYSIAYKPLPFPGANRWVSIQLAEKAASTASPRIDAYTYQQWQEHRRNVDYIGAFTAREAVLSEGEESNALRGAAITPSLLSAMGIQPLLGRTFAPDDGQATASTSVILSYDTWQKYFAADRSIVGRQIRVNAQTAQVVGVMPKGFYAFRDYEIWFPLALGPIASPSASTLRLSVLARRADGVTDDAILAELQPIVQEINTRYPGTFDAKRHVELFPAFRIYSHENMPIIAVSGFIAIAVLLLGAMNISMIFYARMVERSRELALRSALGSSRGRLLRQCLLESLLVVVVGLLLGIGLAMLGVKWGQSIRDFPSRILATGSPWDYPQMRISDLVAGVIAATVVWLASTLVPALRLTRQDAAKVMGGSGKGTASAGKSRAARFLVGAQVIVSCLLLVICASLVFAVNGEASKPLGIRVNDLYVSSDPSSFSARYADATERNNYWNDLSRSMTQRIPGAETVIATAVPTRPDEQPVSIEGRQDAAGESSLKLPVTAVSDNYFSVLGITARSGRFFDGTDVPGGAQVAVVDEELAKRYWPGQDPLGKRLQIDPVAGGPWLVVVGVASHVASEPYGGEKGLVYRSIRQATPASFQVAIRVPPHFDAAETAVREAAFAVDRDLPLRNIQPMPALMEALDIGYASIVPVFSAIVAITVLLAGSGLFGMISRSVAQRTQEIGIRRALGSSKARVRNIFMRQAVIYLAVALTGGALGILLVNMLTSVIPNALVHIAMVMLGVVIVMFVVVFSASYFPARRAVSLEPGEALRYE